MISRRLCVIFALAALLAACSAYPAGERRLVKASGEIRLQPGSNRLSVTFGGPAYRMRSLQEAGVTAIRVTVEGPGLVEPAATSVAIAALGLPGPHAQFVSLPPGLVSVTAEAIDAACGVRYRGIGVAVIAPERVAVADLSLEPLLAPEAPSGGCSEPTPSPRASATAGPSPTPAPSATPTPPPTGTLLDNEPVGSRPTGVAVGADGTVWVSDTGSGTVSRRAPNGTLKTIAVGAAPRGIAIDAAGTVWVAVSGADAVVRLAPDGTELGRTSVDKDPWDVAIDPEGRAWVVHEKKKTAYVLGGAGQVLARHRVEKEPQSLAIAPSGMVWVTSTKRDRVQRLDATGQLLGETAVAEEPAEVAVGPDGRAWVIAREQGQLFEIGTDGEVRSVRGVGASPCAVLVDRAGRVWVANGGDGTLSVLGPSGMATYDMGFEMAGLALDPSGDVWVTDYRSGAVRRVAR